MKNIFLELVFISCFTVISSISSAHESNKAISPGNSFYPAKENITLTYKTSFGETTSKFSYNDQNVVSINESDKFKYRQILNIENDGIYVTETFQKIKLFLFLTKEATYTYNKPLLRLPTPLIPGKTWTWEGIEYSDGDSNTVNVSGKIFDKEQIIVPAGKFDAMKVQTTIESSSKTKNIITEWYSEEIGLIKASIVIEGGGLMGMVRDILTWLRRINF
jgi:hypothetical protein